MVGNPQAALETARRARSQPLGRAIAGLTRRALDKRGFVDVEIVNRWPEIAGELIGGNSLPDKITFSRDRSKPGTLHLLLANGALATEIIHFEPVLLERINRYFGFRAVGRIKIIHGPIPRAAATGKKALPPLKSEARAKIADSLSSITDDELKDALSRLGAHVAQRRASEEQQTESE